MIDDLWYKNAIIYSLNVGTFMDSNGDGIGDFEGLSRCLDYLSGLGVTCIWLQPFQPSPNRDGGYDISDYYGVDPRHGSSGDFVDFTHQAKQRGIRVIIDLVVNHTSDQHPWFQSARADKNSRYRSWYAWSKTRPKDYRQGMVFPGVQRSTWTFDKVAHEWYFHRFYEFQPDLNTENPDVRTEIQRIMGYWLQLGVSGFRLDAVPFIIETQDSGKRHIRRYEYLTAMRDFLQWREGDGILLGEANIVPEDDVKFFGDEGDRMHMMFNFYVNQHMFYAFASGDVRPLAKAIQATQAIPEYAQWASFLRNHDELDLGRLTEKQRQLVYSRFGLEKAMQLYGRGIRRRLAPMLSSPQQLQLAYSLMMALPATPVLRYGDEIGMGDDLSLRERDSVRTPMQWSDEPNGGFSTAKKTILPVIDDGVWSYKRINVAAQRRDPNSLMNWMERMIRLRKECPEIGWGTPTILSTGNSNVLGMRYDWRTNSIVTLHNLDEKPKSVRLNVGIEGGERLVNLIVGEHSRAEPDGKHRIVLEGYGYRWYRVGGLNYILKRQKY
ncbi:MAG TPA: alpha-amylase family protein [Terriglobia bacterium]|nr:alpha-amylase family protein [Terriglobia bacterium]